MRPSAERRLVILTEGQFEVHNAKTALGVMRYGRDTVVCLLDSTIAGRMASEIVGVHPRFDVPAVATLEEALALRPDALLIGIAPTGGRLPPDWRSTILAAIRAGLDVLSGLHTFLGDDPEFAAAAARRGDRDRRLPPPAGADGDGRGPAPRTGQARHPDRRDGLRDRQDVGRPRAPPGGRSRPGCRVSSSRPARPG